MEEFMSSIKSWICAAVLLGLLLAGCAAQPVQSPTPGASDGKSGSYTGPADRTLEPNTVPVDTTGGGGGNGSLQTPYPGPLPTNAGTPTPIQTADNPVLTLDNSGETLTLKVGQSFLLKLGEAYDWQIIIADQSVVSRVKNVMVIRGAQGLYSALQAGQTEFSAQGDPLCRSQKPACELPSVLFRQTIIVN
jgi:hypothetical protein